MSYASKLAPALRFERRSSRLTAERTTCCARPEETWYRAKDLNPDVSLIGGASCRWMSPAWKARWDSNPHIASLGGWWLIRLAARARILVAPEGFQPSSLSVRSGVSYAFERRGHKLGSGPENRTLPCTLIRGDYRLIRPACTPVLTTMEARVGIEPTIGLFCRQPPSHLANAPWQEQ